MNKMPDSVFINEFYALFSTHKKNIIITSRIVLKSTSIRFLLWQKSIIRYNYLISAFIP